MARPARFTDEDVLDAALAVVAVDGRDARIEDVAARLHCRVGTIYYRFASRQVLLARLWIRSVRRYQGHFNAALDHPDPTAALTGAACTIPDYCRARPEEAAALTLFRHPVLLADCPDELTEDVTALNTETFARIEAGIVRRFGRSDDQLRALTRAAVQETPYGLVRPYLGTDRPIPGWLTDAVEASVPAMLALGDRW